MPINKKIPNVFNQRQPFVRILHSLRDFSVLLTFEHTKDKSPFDLSGGQKRLVALAGVLAMKPEYLILDEPLAGLDPKGKAEFLNIINILHKEAGITILMVSHDASSVAKYADRIIYLEKGKALFAGETEKTFYNMFEHDNGTEQLPVIMQLLILLRKKGLPVDCLNADIEGGVTEIIRAIR